MHLVVLRIRPDYVDAHNNLGVALAKKGDLKGAFTHFSEALRIRPSDSEAINNYGFDYGCLIKYNATM